MKCFVAGTLVLTASGLVAIENIKPGDMVYAADAELIDKNGNTLYVEQIYREKLDNQFKTVYNFKVDGFHTYFVGRTMIPDHNAKYDVGKYNEMPNEPGMDKHHVPQKAVMKNLIQIYRNHQLTYL